MTPAYRWPLLESATGAPTWVKHENATPTGAFKVRGGLVYLARLLELGPVRGLITATRGNHGQSLAFAGRAHNIPVTVVVPEGNSPDKNAAMQGRGAQLVVRGRDFQGAREHMAALPSREGWRRFPPSTADLRLALVSVVVLPGPVSMVSPPHFLRRNPDSPTIDVRRA